jgi:DNA-binding IclR family transcriptional regulator
MRVNVKMSDVDTGTLGKAVSLLELVVMSEQPLRFVDILQRSGQPRGTLHRQLSHLLAEGLLEQNADQCYVAGVRILKFAAQAWSRNDLRSIAAPHLRALQELTQESVHLGVLRGTEITYLDKVDGKQAVRMYSQIGRTSPVHCTGVGKAALSLLSDADLAQTIGKIDFHVFTPHTIATPERLMQEVVTIRKNGFGFDLEEHEVGIQCVAAPIVTSSYSVFAAISVTGPAYRLRRENLEQWSATVREVSRSISHDLSSRLPPT